MLKPRNLLLALVVAGLLSFATSSARAQNCYSSGYRGYSSYSTYRVPTYSSYRAYSPYQSYRAYPTYQRSYPIYGHGYGGYGHTFNHGYGGNYYGRGVGIGIQGNRGGGFYIRF